MYKAAIMYTPYPNSPPTAKEVQNYLKGSGTLLYGGNKRKSALTPNQSLMDKVYVAFQRFEHVITGTTGNPQSPLDSYDLYVFDLQVDDVHFLLKYGGQVQCYFKLNEQIISSMEHHRWSHWRLEQLKKSVQSNARHDQFIAENVGDAKFHRSIPKFARASTDFILKVESAMTRIELEAVSLFKSGW